MNWIVLLARLLSLTTKVGNTTAIFLIQSRRSCHVPREKVSACAISFSEISRPRAPRPTQERGREPRGLWIDVTNYRPSVGTALPVDEFVAGVLAGGGVGLGIRPAETVNSPSAPENSPGPDAISCGARRSKGSRPHPFSVSIPVRTRMRASFIIRISPAFPLRRSSCLVNRDWYPDSPSANEGHRKNQHHIRRDSAPHTGRPTVHRRARLPH